MGDIAIRAVKIGKVYQIGQWNPYPTLRAAIANYFTTAVQRLGGNIPGAKRMVSANDGSPVSDMNSDSKRPTALNPLASEHPDHIWALKDISFEVKKGETLGIIGRNGSGKSTLLKLMAQITEPTEGEIYISGRVTALIELGAGFHPELTGRENIYLSGAILGLTKKEVDSSFAAIVDFAELWDFIDTPVKHYSNGMTVRLGFAVAMSVDPQILLVDEVLAVGDAAFRKRCLERIDAFIGAGKTLILVTHSLEEVQRLACKAMLIDHGFIKAVGAPEDVIACYTSLIAENTASREIGS
jgi:lipopolysaccharide transport system ATP-binding protein